MKRFPQFLKTNPSFHGLQFSDIAGLMVILYMAMILGLNPLITIGLSILVIGVMKILKKNFDFTGLLVPRKKEIHLADIYRGEK